MRSLYIDGSRRSLVLRDGPSLRVVTEGRADGMYPFRRLARVVVIGPVNWDCEALLACLDEGVPVTFLTSEGEPRAFCLAARPRPQRLEHRLEDFLARTDWRSLYENWRRSAERKAILAVLRQLRARVPDLRAERVAQWLLEAIASPSQQRLARAILRCLEGLLSGLVTARLSEAGIPGPLLIERRPGWNLPADMTRLAGWRHYLWLGEILDRAQAQSLQPGQVAFRRMLAEVFESHSAETNRGVKELIDGFAYWLGGVL